MIAVWSCRLGRELKDWRGLKRRLLPLAIGVALLAWVIQRQGPVAILALLMNVGWGVVPIALLHVVYQMVRGAALRQCLPDPATFGFARAFQVRVSGEAVQFLTATGPFLSEPTKAWLVARSGVTGAEAFAATLAEYLASTIVGATMLAGAMLWLLEAHVLSTPLERTAIVLLVISTLFLVVAIVAIWRRIYLIGAVLRWLAALPRVGPKLRIEPLTVRRFEDRLLALLRHQPSGALALFGLEILADLILVIELAWILALAGLPFSLGRSLLIESASKFTMAAFFFIPGQVGAAEGVFTVIVQILGWPGTVGVAVVLVRRLRTMLVSGFGVASLSILSSRE
jgi:hypothetical protein